MAVTVRMKNDQQMALLSQSPGHSLHFVCVKTDEMPPVVETSSLLPGDLLDVHVRNVYLT